MHIPGVREAGQIENDDAVHNAPSSSDKLGVRAAQELPDMTSLPSGEENADEQMVSD